MTEEKTTPEAGWNFDNSYARLPESLYQVANPTPVRSPELVAASGEVAKALGLDIQALHSRQGIEILAGNQLPEGALPIAQAYAGHQFGYFTKLGDGRAVLLGEQITPGGERYDIQLKGAGRTPFSRGGDGRAALGPMLREFIISEAMHALGIPTTRSLAVVTTGQPVQRDTELPGAVLTRVAASHLRVGTFQYAAAGGTSSEELQTLADYTIQRHFPEVLAEENRYLGLLQQVIQRQAELIAKWQLVGFIHGVMNTDNMALSGESIDFGPCAFMDTYDPDTVFSSIDQEGRYAYGNQPQIAAWNLARFAETLLPLLHADREEAVKLAEGEIYRFTELFHGHWLSEMRAKLGLSNEEPEDESLIQELLEMMKNTRADYTNTFRALTFGKLEDTPMYGTNEFAGWYEKWQARLDRQPEGAAHSEELMRSSNPAVIPRNHRVEEALQAAVTKGDYSVMERLLEVLASPYAHSADQLEYTTVPESTSRPYRTYCGT
ncbi:protein adenylyltransferase SelO [Paenibacillus sp. YPG26]|uniref:protein adenylyltransferase SelO n=1 Tax=Paenibacillus sp. YPG26 TaxID=2878915 RepID=UPI00203CC2A5|nr:YdiU family protein [Paenibacillus sp. YPG26]USB32297.1 YdiU family protein [Paenibacillus sp. YPG26]